MYEVCNTLYGLHSSYVATLSDKEIYATFKLNMSYRIFKGTITDDKVGEEVGEISMSGTKISIIRTDLNSEQHFELKDITYLYCYRKIRNSKEGRCDYMPMASITALLLQLIYMLLKIWNIYASSGRGWALR